jgi:DNA repair exonuclease SbcCD ATPase subunit
MIEFEEIVIEGFGSMLGPFSYRLNKTGINIIMGLNGAGKTTIFSALSWCLFGKPLKDIKSIEPWPWVLPENFKGTLVITRFKNKGVPFEVTRCLGYKEKIEGFQGKDRLILKEGEVLSGLRNKPEIQARIEEILGYSFSLFKHSILFGQNLTRLIREKGPDKKKLLDEAFEVAFINHAKKNSEKSKLELLKAKQEVNPKLDSILTKRDELFKRRSREIFLQEKWERDNKKGIKHAKNQLKDFEEKLKGLENTKKLLPEVEDQLKNLYSQRVGLKVNLKQYEDLSNEQFKLEMKLEQEKGELEDLLQESSKLQRKFASVITKCSRCNQPLDKKKVKEEKDKIREEVSKISKKALEQKGKVGELVKELEGKKELVSRNKEYKNKEIQLDKEIKKLEESKNRYQIAIGNEELYKQQIIDTKGSILKLKNEKPDHKTHIDKLSKKIKKLNKQSKPLIKESRKIGKELEVINWLIDDPLSNRGLKAYIFESMVQLVNRNLETYGNQIGYIITFFVDMESAHKNLEVKITRKGKEVFYEELSGGQQQLVDVSTAFAIHDTVTVNKGCNILMMDEVFESLDASNIELVIDLIKSKSRGLAIHVITHREEFALRTSKVVRLKLEKGVTKVI